MGSLNITEWTPDQVAEWMSGLGPKVTQYIPQLHEKGLNGAKLLMLRCDDLEYLGIHIIGHQELLLEAVEHLRNFHYEISRECVQQLALRVSSAAWQLARALRHHADARLETHSLADVARTVHAVKPLVCWLDRWPLGAGSPLAERKAALLKLSLEAATCAQRERFAEQPAHAVAAAAAAVAAVADFVIQDVSDPMILQPASLDTVTLRQGERALGFEVVPSFCGHHQLAHIRFASPAHASGLVHEADEIVEANGKCVLGWSGEAVERTCLARSSPDLVLRLRRRGARPLPVLSTPPLRVPRPRAHLHVHKYSHMHMHSYMHMYARLPLLHTHLHTRIRYEAEEASPERERPPPSSSDESEALSPPASPTHLHMDAARLYPPAPAPRAARRHSVCGSPAVLLAHAPRLAMHSLWQELQQRRLHRDDDTLDDTTLYRRDKAVSCSTGLQLSPRPRTCLGVPRPLDGTAPVPPALPSIAPAPATSPRMPRGKLDKSHSTPAYDFNKPTPLTGHAPTLTSQPIPESPTTEAPIHEKAGQILEFKKSSTQIEEAIQRNRRTADDEKEFVDDDIKLIDDDRLEIVETVNTVLRDHVGIKVDRQPSLRREESLTVKAPDAAEDLSTPVKYPKPRITECFKPPSPPPRPAHTRARLPYHETWEAVGSGVVGPVAMRPGAVGPGAVVSHPALKLLPRVVDTRDLSPLKPIRPGDPTQISVPLRHITKHDIQLISTERRELPPINGEPDPPAPLPTAGPMSSLPNQIAPLSPNPAPSLPSSAPSIVIGAASEGSGLGSPKIGALSPSGSVVRGFFPSSKSRSLKKKNSILAKRRDVPARCLAPAAACGRVWQRVRGQGAAQARWAPRHLLLTHNLLYAYRSPECSRAACMIQLAGFTASAAGEVHSRAHAFKVYHTGRAFYFAATERAAMLAWLALLQRAVLLPAAPQTQLSKQFSETDYSETESDAESSERKNERDREREREKEKEKSKFGSLKKLTHRAGRSESQENVNQSASTSLDRKYLRIFSRMKAKEDKSGKSKQINVPIPTEHYRSYRRAPPAPPAPPPASSKLPKPINYIHASNPNLLDFEKSDFVTKPAITVPKPKTHKTDNIIGFVTLEEFMLKKQEEERQQVYTDRVLMGVERKGGGASMGHSTDRKVVGVDHAHSATDTGKRGGSSSDSAHNREQGDLQRRLELIVPDVIYGVSSAELPLPVLELQARHLPAPPPPAAAPAHPPAPAGKPLSVAGKDGYEKIVYPEERESTESKEDRGDARRASLRRADKVHSGSPHVPSTPVVHDSWSASAGGAGVTGGGGGGGVSLLRQMFGGTRRDLQRQESQRGEQYPHLQCPPTFQPETYSLRPRRD